MQLLIACSVDVLLVVTAFSELAQFFAYFLHVTVASKGWNTKYESILDLGIRKSNTAKSML